MVRQHHPLPLRGGGALLRGGKEHHYPCPLEISLIAATHISVTAKFPDQLR